MTTNTDSKEAKPTQISFIELGTSGTMRKDYSLYSDGKVHYFEDGRNQYIPDTNEWLEASSLKVDIKQKLLEATPKEFKQMAATFLSLSIE